MNLVPYIYIYYVNNIIFYINNTYFMGLIWIKIYYFYILVNLIIKKRVSDFQTAVQKLNFKLKTNSKTIKDKSYSQSKINKQILLKTDLQFQIKNTSNQNQNRKKFCKSSL